MSSSNVDQAEIYFYEQRRQTQTFLVEVERKLLPLVRWHLSYDEAMQLLWLAASGKLEQFGIKKLK